MNKDRIVSSVLVFLLGVVIAISGFRIYKHIKAEQSELSDISENEITLEATKIVERGASPFGEEDASSASTEQPPDITEETKLNEAVREAVFSTETPTPAQAENTLTPKEAPSLSPSPVVTIEPTPSPAPETSFTIRFFDVGEADSTLIECDGHYMLVDGGAPKSSSFLYSYLEQHGIDYLDYIVCTHAHEDHVGGLAGALNYAKVGIAYAPVSEGDTRAFNSFVKYLTAQGKSIIIPTAGDVFFLGSAEVTILAPLDISFESENVNNTSIILRIVYGTTSFLLMADAEVEEEYSILNAGYDIRSTVLKIGHHGSNTSTSQELMDAVSPQYCIISVGKNSYGHPSEEVLDRITRQGASLYRTDMNGDIVCSSNGDSIDFLMTD